MSLELRPLRYFVAVAEELHFGRAAARLHMAQPALSQAIQKLEAQLGVELLRRSSRRVELTAAGAVLLDEARALLDRADVAVVRARRAARTETNRVVAGFLGSPGTWLAPEIVRVLRAEHPEIDVGVEDIAATEQLDGLAEGRLDVAFLRPVVDLAGYRHEVVQVDSVCAVLPLGHRLAFRESISLDELADERFVALEGYEPFLRHECARFGFEADVAERARTLHTYLVLVAAGIGVGMMPESARGRYGEPAEWVTLEGIETELVMVWRDEPETPALRALLAVAREAVAGVAEPPTAASISKTS